MYQSIRKLLLLALCPTFLIAPALADEVERECRKDAETIKRDCIKDCRLESKGAKFGCITGGDEAVAQCASDCVNNFEECTEGAADTFAVCTDTCRDTFKTAFQACDDGVTGLCSLDEACLLCRNTSIFDRNGCLSDCREQKREDRIIGGCVSTVRQCVNACKQEAT